MIAFPIFLAGFLAGPAPVPPWANVEVHLYDTSQVPILRDDSSASRLTALGTRPSSTLDTGAYKLDLSGSKSISVTTGGGGVGVDASLLVNVKGQLSENVFLEGSLSDQNVPVQPQGNTANLREVDNKYLRVYGNHYEYLLGDYFLGYGRAGEDRFAIKADGARLEYGRSGFGVSAQYALSKGLFHTDTLRGVDGKQSGYYLRGRDGNSYITVLAGTERIWRNGVLLQRGNDYTIDYAEGRVDFLKNIWVTGENLFSAEFQYTENSFPRSVFATEVSDTLGRFRFGVRAIQEWDDKNNPATGEPDALTLGRYENAGDSTVTDSLGHAVPFPKVLTSTAVSAEWEGGEQGHDRFVLLGSRWDQNLYSTVDDENNLGYSTRFSGVHRFGKPLDQGGLLRLEIDPAHEHRSRNFTSFHQLVEARSFRDAWNLDGSVGERNFDANSLRLSLEPRTGFQVGAEGGLAGGKMFDSISAKSKRGEVFAQLHSESTRVDLSSQAKLATDPNRRDNYRQNLASSAMIGGWNPKLGVLHDEWLLAVPVGTAKSHLWQPDASLESPTLWNRWIWTSAANALYSLSNYGGQLAASKDSLLDIGFSQRLRLLSWGIFSGEVFAARRFHQEWKLQTDGTRSSFPEKAFYDQAQIDLAASGYPQGYGVQTHYQVNRTAEIPLINAYQKVDSGRGDYAFDSLLNSYQKVETGGDYIFSGLRRDTTLGSRPYQDLQWTMRVDLSPGKWSKRISGVLADIDLSLDLATDYQDSSSDPVPLPRLTDAQIEGVRSGRARYEPSLRWHAPNGKRSATFRYQRDYSKGAGIYAYRELDSKTDAEYRWAWSDDWEALWGGALQSKDREGLTSSSPAAASHTDAQQARVELYRHLPRSFTLVPGLEYEAVRGTDAGLPLDLQGFTPRARLEKGSFFGGRASVEYALHYLYGQGEGSYFATEGYRKGLTNRIEVLAQSELQSHLHLNLSYLARLEPHASSWDQRMTAEMRALF